jgi:hemerythrin-like domain-containing protein
MTDAPDAKDYRIIHHCLRTAPHRLATALAEAADVSAGDHARARAIADYWTGYAGEVLAHHTVEDEVFFPRLVARVPVAATHLDRVEVEHHRLDELMDAAARATGRYATTAAARDAEAAAAVVDELATLMDAHLDFEDADLVPLFERHFTVAEYAELTTAAQKGLSIKQAAFTVPFVMHWAEPDDARELLADAPLALRLLHVATRRRHARLTNLALGPFGLPAALEEVPA